MNLTSNVGPAGYQQTALGPNGGEVQAVNADGSAASIAYAPASPAAWNPAPSTVAGALDELTTERTTFVFQPGATAAGNVFASWAALYAATLLTPGPKRIVFSNVSGGVCNIPAGAYDFGLGCMFDGVLPGDGTTGNRVDVICADGVTFTTPLQSIDHIRLTYNGTAALMTVPGNGRIFHFEMHNLSRVSMNASGGRIFDIPAGAILLVDMYDGAVVNAPVAGALFVNVTGATAATNLTITIASNMAITSVLPINCLAGPAGATYAFAANHLNLFQGGTQVPPLAQQNGMPGGVITVGFTSSAANEFYSPAVPAQWVAPAPNNVKAALDRIAAVVSVGGATPIP
jgi:hypothetical protein